MAVKVGLVASSLRSFSELRQPMTPRLIRDLLAIASEANRWPRLKHLRDEALRELEAAHLNCVEQIIPIMIVKDDAEDEPPRSEVQSPSTRIPRGLT
jgi:hypothetical protein